MSVLTLWFLQLSLQPKIHVYLVTWVMWPSIFSVFSKITRQKTTQPWWPLLPSYYYAAVCDTDMAGGEHHHRWPYYANMTDDLPPPSWLAHKNTSKMVHPPMTSKYSAPTTCIVSSIYDCYGAAIVTSDRYICVVASGVLYSQSGPSHSAQADVHMICMKSNFIPTSTSINLNTNLTTPSDRAYNIYDICAAFMDWNMPMVWSVSMEMRDILLVWYVHNNQLYCNYDGGINWFNNILEWKIIWEVYDGNVYLRKYTFK